MHVKCVFSTRRWIVSKLSLKTKFKFNVWEKVLLLIEVPFTQKAIILFEHLHNQNGTIAYISTVNVVFLWLIFVVAFFYG